MTVVEFSAIVAAGSFCAGFLGSLTGLGGGVIVVPMLTLAMGVDIHYAIGASLVSVIATSSGAAAAYVREGFTNIRIGMFLEMATTIGALAGAYIASYLPAAAIAVVFGIVLLQSAIATAGKKASPAKVEVKPEGLAKTFHLHGEYPGADGPVRYAARRVPLGFGLMGLAGVLSGLLGIGSGAVKVIAMDQAMGLPFKVSTTTSNFMIGVTAAASAGVYLRRGYIDPGVAMPVMLGVLAGSFTGARVLAGAKSQTLRWVFSGVAAVIALQMIYKGLTGNL